MRALAGAARARRRARQHQELPTRARRITSSILFFPYPANRSSYGPAPSLPPPLLLLLLLLLSVSWAATSVVSLAVVPLAVPPLPPPPPLLLLPGGAPLPEVRGRDGVFAQDDIRLVLVRGEDSARRPQPCSNQREYSFGKSKKKKNKQQNPRP